MTRDYSDTSLLSIFNKNKKKLDILSNTFNNNKGIIYIENVFPKEIFQKILNHCHTHYSINKLKTDYMVNDTNSRKGTHIHNGYIRELLSDTKFQNMINYLVNNCDKDVCTIKDKNYLSEFPIEYRLYPTGSQGMDWHIDTLLFEKPQYELVYTIKNTSDSATEWLDKNDNKHIIKTKPNSLIIVKALGPAHSVTPITEGDRSILKFIFSDSNKKSDIYDYDIKCRYNKC